MTKKLQTDNGYKLETGMKQQAEIVMIKSQVEAVRKMSDVYLGALNNAGFMNMVREIVQNSGDQISKGNSVDKNIIVSFDARSHAVIVEDFGQGIPVEQLADVFSTLYSSSNYNKIAGSSDFSSGKYTLITDIKRFCPDNIVIYY